MLSLCVCAVAEEEQRTLLEALQQHIFGSARSSPATANSHHRVSAYQQRRDCPAGADHRSRDGPRAGAAPVVPGRCEAASRLHLARTVARRAERRLVELAAEVTIRQILLRYLNRLSDCLPGAQRGSCRSPAPPCDGDRGPLSGRQRVACARRAQSPGRVASFHELHQLIRQAIEHARQLQVPVVVSIVDAHGTETVTRMPDALLVSSELAPKAGPPSP